MAASKTFFEQIPIETVKRIALEFPGENVSGSDSANTEMPDEVRSAGESWREVAQRVQHERDPKRMTELVEQLIATLDEAYRRKAAPPEREPGNRSH